VCLLHGTISFFECYSSLFRLYDLTFIDSFIHSVFCLRTGPKSVAYAGILFEGGFPQIQLRTEEIENGDLEAVAP